MTWKIEPATALDDWVEAEKPSAELIFEVAVRWTGTVTKYGPHDARIGFDVVWDEANSLLWCQLVHFEPRTLVVKMWVNDRMRSVTLLEVTTGPHRQLP